jgi:hypothetical protein
MRMILVISAVLTATILFVQAVPGQDRLTSPYRANPLGGVRGISTEEVTALREGNGMGLARAAELNSYPGPRHVLAAVEAGQLQATLEQVERTTAIYATMRRDAQQVGAQILGEEASLESAFRSGTISEPDLTSRVARIAELQGELRSIHLAAHLATRAILTDEQVQKYNAIRGYAAEPTGHQHTH